MTFFVTAHPSASLLWNMPKFEVITDKKSIEKYDGDRIYFAPPINLKE